jgi:hypothetical protein
MVEDRDARRPSVTGLVARIGGGLVALVAVIAALTDADGLWVVVPVLAVATGIAVGIAGYVSRRS